MDQSLPICLNVNTINYKAINLYFKMGFKITKVMREYYKENGDGFFMTKKIEINNATYINKTIQKYNTIYTIKNERSHRRLLFCFTETYFSTKKKHYKGSIY
jgi:hypothetical protein